MRADIQWHTFVLVCLLALKVPRFLWGTFKGPSECCELPRPGLLHQRFDQCCVPKNHSSRRGETLTKKPCAGVMNQQVLWPACFTWHMSFTTTPREGFWPTPTVEVSTHVLSAHHFSTGIKPLKTGIEMWKIPVHRLGASYLPIFIENLAFRCSSSCSSVALLFQGRTVTVVPHWGPCWGQEARTPECSYHRNGRKSWKMLRSSSLAFWRICICNCVSPKGIQGDCSFESPRL